MAIFHCYAWWPNSNQHEPTGRWPIKPALALGPRPPPSASGRSATVGELWHTYAMVYRFFTTNKWPKIRWMWHGTSGSHEFHVLKDVLIAEMFQNSSTCPTKCSPLSEEIRSNQIRSGWHNPPTYSAPATEQINKRTLGKLVQRWTSAEDLGALLGYDWGMGRPMLSKVFTASLQSSSLYLELWRPCSAEIFRSWKQKSPGLQ